MAVSNSRPYTVSRQVLYVNGAAELLGDTPKAVRAKVARRLIPFHKLGGRVIFLKDELEAFLRNLPGCSFEEAAANVAARNGVEREEARG